MIVTICYNLLQLTLTQVAAILDVINMAAPGLIRLGAHKQSNKYGLGNIYYASKVVNMVRIGESI